MTKKTKFEMTPEEIQEARTLWEEMVLMRDWFKKLDDDRISYNNTYWKFWNKIADRLSIDLKTGVYVIDGSYIVLKSSKPGVSK